MGFAHLHLHTEYSFLDGFGHPEEYVKRAAALDLTAFAVTDHGGLWGWARAFTVCREAGMKFIPGVEFFMDSPDVDKTQSRIAWEHLTVLAMDQTGYQNLLVLASLAGQRLHRNRPILTYSDLFKHHEGLMVLSGCTSSRVVRFIVSNDLRRAWQVLQAFRQILGDRFYVEIQPNTIDKQVQANPILVDMAHRLHIPLVATNDVHYILPGDAAVHEVMLCVQTRDVMKNPDRWRFTWNGFYLASPAEMAAWFTKHHPGLSKRDIQLALDNAGDIAARSNVTQPIPAHYILPAVKNPAQVFTQAVQRGFRHHGLHLKPNVQDYVARVQTEMAVITQQGLATYLLIVADLVRWARERMLVGPGRGSSGGSLVCYCLGITEVDPLVHHTLFERFITDERTTPPDIDMDFPGNRREEIIAYLRQRYGETSVAQITTHTRFKGKLALWDVARAYDVPTQELNRVTPLVINRSRGDARADMTVEDLLTYSQEFKAFAGRHPQVVRTSMRLEGIVRQLGKHAAGVVLTDRPYTELFPTFVDKDGIVLSQWDMHGLEDLKLLKIDILGLDILDTMTQTLALVAQRHGQQIDLANLPLDDKATLASFNSGHTTGVFQFESKGIALWTRQIGVQRFRDVVDLVALYRPGTLHSGMIAVYERRKKGQETWTYPHPYLKPILDVTYGITLYQEQIMFIFHKLANFPWRDSDRIRKVISKKEGVEQFHQWLNVFVQGCQKHGIDAPTATKMFETVRTFGSYGFNLSHAVAYAMIAYRSMWLKVHYPLEYMTALLSQENDKERVLNHVKECRRLKIPLLLPHADKSGWTYQIEGKAIRCGLKEVKGIGEKATAEIVRQHPFRSWPQFLAKVDRRLVNSRVIKALVQCNAMQGWGPTIRALHLKDWEALRALLDRKHPAVGGPTWLQGLSRLPEYPEDMLRTLRHEVFPLVIGSHPMTEQHTALRRYKRIRTPETVVWKREPCLLGGVITNIGYSIVNKIINGENKPHKLMFFTLDGERDYVNAIVARGSEEEALQQRIRDYNGQAVVIKGMLNPRKLAVYCTAVKRLADLR